MKHGFPGVAMLCLVLLAVAFGCSPKPPPAVAPTTPAAAQAPTRPQPSSTATTEDVEWQQVIKAAQAEGKLVLYDATFFAGDRRIAVPKAFKEKYGISMEILVTGGS